MDKCTVDNIIDYIESQETAKRQAELNANHLKMGIPNSTKDWTLPISVDCRKSVFSAVFDKIENQSPISCEFHNAKKKAPDIIFGKVSKNKKEAGQKIQTRSSFKICKL